jgi:1-acyl-sn-glycerol-3-phosphate acyltransferase
MGAGMSAPDETPEPDEAAPDDAVPGEATPDETAPDEAAPRRRFRVGLPDDPTLAGRMRHTLWLWVFQAVGGLRVTGSAPLEAMVVAANHSSHADTPAVLAAFPSPYKPVAVAADDYWFTHRLRGWAARTFVGAVPVTRKGSGGFEGLVEQAREVLGHGGSLLIFPEGTRTTTGELGHFHSGAMHLARQFDVPVLPVAIVGTRELLPKGGRLLPGPVEVRVGTPIAPEDWDGRGVDAVRDQIEALLAAGPARAGVSRDYTRLRAFAECPGALAGAFAWGLAEAVSWPVTAEMFLVFYGVAAPRRMPHLVGALAAGSATGVLVTAALTRRGMHAPAPLTTAAMRARADEHIAAGGAAGMWRQALNGIPVKVYARAAGEQRVPLGPLAAHTLGARAARASFAGLVLGYGAHKAAPLMRRFAGPYESIAAAAWVVGEAFVAGSWRHRR